MLRVAVGEQVQLVAGCLCVASMEVRPVEMARAEQSPLGPDHPWVTNVCPLLRQYVVFGDLPGVGAEDRVWAALVVNGETFEDVGTGRTVSDPWQLINNV